MGKLRGWGFALRGGEPAREYGRPGGSPLQRRGVRGSPLSWSSRATSRLRRRGDPGTERQRGRPKGCRKVQWRRRKEAVGKVRAIGTGLEGVRDGWRKSSCAWPALQ